MDILWLVFAFVCGLGVKLAGLPPLIGFLIAGFALNVAGVEPNQALEALANLGITLMLFTIGLKLNVRDLLKREVWGSTLSLAAIWMIVATSLLMVAAVGALGFAAGLDLRGCALVAFALSFSSTVCVIKVLEDSGELKTRHGGLAIGVLVLQDVIAVIFLVLATGKTPSPWAFGLLGLVALRPLLGIVLGRAGHGEMLPLTGFMLALGGYELFSAVDIKGDLGALIVGIMLSDHVKANELSKSLLHFKDIFLIGFFLSIGMTALPDMAMMATAVVLCLLVPLKMTLFFWLMTRLGLRARTSYLSSLVLSNYSEFGLIIMVLSVNAGWISNDWLVITALAVALSFVLTSTVYRKAHGFYARRKDSLRRFEKSERLPADRLFRPREAEILVVGIGRVGLGAFRALHKMAGDRVWGMDASRDRIERLREQGMHVFTGDAENADLWDMLDVRSIRLVLLAIPSVDDNRNIAAQLRIAGYAGPIAGIARYDDEVPMLREAGIDKVFNYFTEVGSGFAKDSLELIASRDSGGSPVPDDSSAPGGEGATA